MQRHWAVVGSIVFFFLAPGTLAFLLPWVISQSAAEPLWRDVVAVQWAALAVGAIGLAALVECFARFALEGLGTPAPVAPPKYLVVTGLYRHVRNPMYVAVVTIILAWALWFGSASLFGYALLVWLGFTVFVLVYEEPTLRSTFGNQYETYCVNVGRWLPRLSPWTPPESDEV
jgi:protein-S-isoprenylcysteine O-methyltransferase Ste14